MEMQKGREGMSAGHRGHPEHPSHVLQFGVLATGKDHKQNCKVTLVPRGEGESVKTNPD